MNIQEHIRCLLEEQETNLIARAELYNLMTFYGHPAQRLGANIAGLYHKLSPQIQDLLLKDNYDKFDGFPIKVKNIMRGNRSLYKRTRGCATQVIDTIANTAKIAPAEIFAPGISNVEELIRERMFMLLKQPTRLSCKEKNRLESKIKELNGGGIDISCLWLEKITSETLLPPYYFLMNDLELRSYEDFREQMIELVQEIIKFYPNDRLHEKMKNYVRALFPKLIEFEDNNPDTFINQFCFRLWQSVLDGNSLFSLYKSPLRSVLMGQFRHFLLDQRRVSERRLRKRPILEIELSSDDLPSGLDSMIFTSPQDDDSYKKVLYDAILTIPSDDDRKILRESLDSIHQGKKHLYYNRVRKAWVRWALHIIETLGKEKIQELPKEWQKELFQNARSAFTVKLRNLYFLVEETRKKGRSRTWLAKHLSVSPHELGKWARGDSFPTLEKLQMLDGASAQAITILENL